MKKFTIHPCDCNDSFEIRNAKDEPLGYVTLAEDECSWYANWQSLDDGPDCGDIRSTRMQAIDDLLAAAAAGWVEIIICS